MRIIAGLLFAVLSAMGVGAARAEVDPSYAAMLARDAPRSADHPFTGRYRGSNLLAQNVKAFDELKLPAGPADGKSYDGNSRFTKVETLRGKVTRTIYVSPPGRSSLEVFTNYRDALAEKGFEPVFECAGEACGEAFPGLKYSWLRKETQVHGEDYEQTRELTVQAVFDQINDPRYALFKKPTPDGDVYAAIYAGLNVGGSMGAYSDLIHDRVSVLVEIVEPKSMDKSMVTLSAEEIGGKLASEGRAAFYNILFDFDKADPKPESAPQLAEMAKFLKSNPKTKVFVIGHTDNKGGLEYNLGLSGKRAQAVAKALAGQYGIDAKRVISRGLGPLAPVATNRTEEGQAKNRRVEMVEQ